MTWDQIRRFKKTWLFRVTVLLLILVEVTTTVAMGDTLASFNAEQAIYYRNHSLTWDAATNVNASGVAELKLFSNKYQNVESDREAVFAPGTKGSDVISLINESSKEITYVALSYNKNPETIPYVADMDAESSVPTTEYVLPSGVQESQVIRAVKGTVAAGNKRDFNIHWEWPFYEGDSQDVVDTDFGVRGIDEAVIGFWVYVEEEESTPDCPCDPDPDCPCKPGHDCPCKPGHDCPCKPGHDCPCKPGTGCNCGGNNCNCKPGTGCNCGGNNCHCKPGTGCNCGGNNCNCKPGTGCNCGGNNCHCKPGTGCNCGGNNCHCKPGSGGSCHCKPGTDCSCGNGGNSGNGSNGSNNTDGSGDKKIIVPKTGDDNRLFLYAGLTILCGAALAMLLIDPKKKESRG